MRSNTHLAPHANSSPLIPTRKRPPAGKSPAGGRATSRKNPYSSHQKRPDLRQHFLKALTGAAWAWVVPTKFLDQFLVAMHDAGTRLDMRLGRETLAPFAGHLKTRTPRNSCVRSPYEPPFVGSNCSHVDMMCQRPDRAADSMPILCKRICVPPPVFAKKPSIIPLLHIPQMRIPHPANIPRREV
jgi:hypothetical protein